MSIEQEIKINAPADRVYSVLTSSEEFSKVTGGEPTRIEASDGGSISLFGGKVSGRNIELVPNERLVQAWRAGNWESGRYSIVRFDLIGEGDQTTIRLTHANYPEGEDQHLDAGWHKMYWEPLKAYLG